MKRKRSEDSTKAQGSKLKAERAKPEREETGIRK
jgi:hypothetical protein